MTSAAGRFAACPGPCGRPGEEGYHAGPACGRCHGRTFILEREGIGRDASGNPEFRTIKATCPDCLGTGRPFPFAVGDDVLTAIDTWLGDDRIGAGRRGRVIEVDLEYRVASVDFGDHTIGWFSDSRPPLRSRPLSALAKVTVLRDDHVYEDIIVLP